MPCIGLFRYIFLFKYILSELEPCLVPYLGLFRRERSTCIIQPSVQLPLHSKLITLCNRLCTMCPRCAQLCTMCAQCVHDVSKMCTICSRCARCAMQNARYYLSKYTFHSCTMCEYTDCEIYSFTTIQLYSAMLKFTADANNAKMF